MEMKKEINMKFKINKQSIQLSLLELILLLFISILSYGQQRIDEEMPKISGTIKSITNFPKWVKDDIGKWEDFNSPQVYDHENKIEVANINYQNNKYLCIAVFSKSHFIKAKVRYNESNVKFWVFDLESMQSLKYDDTSVITKIYDNVVESDISVSYFASSGNLKPISWKEILIQMKKCFIGTYPNINSLYGKFFFKYRYEYKLNKTQFLIGSLGEQSKNIDTDKYEDFNPGFFPNCNGKNVNLECGYYEISKNIFDSTFKELKE